MVKKVVYTQSLLISGIMCAQSCRPTIEKKLNKAFHRCKKLALIEEDAEIQLDSDPAGLGLHRVFIVIRSDKSIDKTQDITNQFKKVIKSRYQVIEDNHYTPQKISYWPNLLINMIALGVIILLHIIFPPSILCTIGSVLVTTLSTAFAARHYLSDFMNSIISKNFNFMSTSITAGWGLSVIHCLYHVIQMPMIQSIPMITMCFIMPIALITTINVMDMIKNKVVEYCHKIQLNTLSDLFPNISPEYQVYHLSQEEVERLKLRIQERNELVLTEDYLKAEFSSVESKRTLKAGMLIRVPNGKCFPVDSILLDKHANLDYSILNGEKQGNKYLFEHVPAGSINLGKQVTALTEQDSYHSQINSILFRANRAKQSSAEPTKTNYFLFEYGLILILILLASLAGPIGLGTLTFGLFLQNLTAILFSICPCTFALIEQLPKVLDQYRLNQQGIIVNKEIDKESLETFIFDKTGTLTTGPCHISSLTKMSSTLWQRVYLLERECGRDHPLARAIIEAYEKNSANPVFQDIENDSYDRQNRGLRGKVQGVDIVIGNAAYLQSEGVDIPNTLLSADFKGDTPVFIAENNSLQGIIFFRQGIRKNLLLNLLTLKRAGKKLIMLTGDTHQSALALNKQLTQQLVEDGLLSSLEANDFYLFDPNNIHAEQTPEKKESFISILIKKYSAKTLCFVADGLNDGLGSFLIDAEGGAAVSISQNDHNSRFSNICSNDGSINYLLEKNRDAFLKKIIQQNKGLFIFGALCLSSFIIAFSILGISISPIVPLFVMSATTIGIILNSQRARIEERQSGWLNHFLLSDWALYIPMAGSGLIITAILIATIASGGLALPVLGLSAAALVSSVLFISGSSLLTIGFLLPLLTQGLYLLAHLFSSQEKKKVERDDLSTSFKVKAAIPQLRQEPVNDSLIPHFSQLYMYSCSDTFSNAGACPALSTSSSHTC